MAFIFVQHLDPKHESVLAQLLCKATKMPIEEITDGLKVRPNQVYVIPPNADMSIYHGALHLSPRATTAGLYMPIDNFLSSLAEDQGAKAVGVVLSGTASDGTEGLKAIKAGGGITLVQDPESAKYDGMPRAAVAGGAVDFVLPPAQLAKELARIGRHPYLTYKQTAAVAELLPTGEGDPKVNDDLINFLTSFNMPMIMVDRGLRIRRFTAEAEKALNLIPADIGRPLGDIKLSADWPDLEDLAAKVIDDITMAELERKGKDGRWYSLRLRPYKTAENKIDGAVMTFVDIDEIKRTRQAIEDARDYAQAIVATVREPLLVLDGSLKVVSANPSFYRLFQTAPKETEGTLIYELGNGQWDIQRLRQLLEDILPRSTEFSDYEVIHDFEQIGRRIMLLNARRLERPEKERQMILLAIDDVTEQKRAEEELENMAKFPSENPFPVIRVNRDGKILFANDASRSLLVEWNSEVGSNAPTFWRQIVAQVLKSSQVKENIEIEHQDRVLSFAAAPVIEAGYVNFYGVDVTERRLISEHHQRIVETTLDAFGIIDRQGRFTEVNDAYCRLLGYSRDELLSLGIKDLEAAETATETGDHLRQIMETGSDHFETRQKRKDGALIDFEVTAAYSTATNRFYAFLHDISARNRAKEMSDALNEINMIVGSTFDFAASMPEVINKAIEAIGCEAGAVALWEDDRWTVGYSAGLQPEFTGVRFTDDQAPHFRIAREMQAPVIVDDVDTDERVPTQRMREANIRSFILVPLIVKGEVFGACSFHYTSAPTAFTEIQVDFARKLAAALSLVITNVKLFDAQHEIAETLQEALLTVPDHISDLAFGRLYESAGEASRVGGDFYDLFELDRDRVGILIGDVSGKGLSAAIITSMVKDSIRAYAFENMAPAEVLTKTNDVIVKSWSEMTFVTAFFGIFDRSNGRLTYCAAGHPPALIQKKDGAIETLEVSHGVIGMFEDTVFTDPSLFLASGERLVLYTDGVTEARRDGRFFGEEGLYRLLKENADIPVEELPSAIFRGVSNYVGGVLSDDLAILVIARQHSQSQNQ